MSEKVERHAALCKMLNEMYQRKNHDYGDSFHLSFLEEGMAMARIRLGDKLNRFKTLTRKPDAQQVQNESIRDTLLDLANYAIMTVMELEGQGKKLVKYKGAVMNLKQSNGVFSIDSSYCSICHLCCNFDKTPEDMPCANCIHNNSDYDEEYFILNESKVEVLE